MEWLEYEKDQIYITPIFTSIRIECLFSILSTQKKNVIEKKQQRILMHTKKYDTITHQLL